MRVIHGPHFIRTRRKRQRHPRFGSKSLAPPALHRQPFLPVQPIHSLVVDPPAKRSVLGLLPSQENVQPPIAESRTHLRSVLFAGNASSRARRISRPQGLGGLEPPTSPLSGARYLFLAVAAEHLKYSITPSCTVFYVRATRSCTSMQRHANCARIVDKWLTKMAE